MNKQAEKATEEEEEEDDEDYTEVEEGEESQQASSPKGAVPWGNDSKPNQLAKLIGNSIALKVEKEEASVSLFKASLFAAMLNKRAFDAIAVASPQEIVESKIIKGEFIEQL